MICALLIGRKGSTGWPGKNTALILGKPLSLYPILALKKSKKIDKIYLSTDDPELIILGKENKLEIITRPDYLATKEALSEDAFLHGYKEIVKLNKKEPEFFIPAFCNSATIDTILLDKGIEVLRKDLSLDSAVSVSKYNMWSALRAMKIENERVLPIIAPSFFKNANCDRDSQGDTYFIDNSVFVVRPKCMDFSYGNPPYKWIGKNIFPLYNYCGLDIDYEWQKSQIEYWLKEHGFSEKKQ